MRARNPYLLDSQSLQVLEEMFHNLEYKDAFRVLKEYLKKFQVTVPTLYKQYADLYEEGGVTFFDFGVDPDFNDAVDGYCLAEVALLKPEKRKRYVETILKI